MSSNLLLKKITVFLSPLALVILWEIWLSFELAAVEIGIAGFLVLAAAIWYLTLRQVAVTQLQRDFHRQEFWRFFITPGIFVFSVFLFLLIIESRFWQQAVVISSNLFLLVVLQNLFDRFYNSLHYPANSFESISGNINSISLFLLATVSYSFYTFLNWPVWFLALLLLLGATFLAYQTMWISGLELRRCWLYILVIDLIVAEFFWVLLFLPNTFYVNGLVIAAVYYLAVNLSRNHLIKVLNQRMVWRYLLIGGIILLLVLLTAKWL